MNNLISVNVKIFRNIKDFKFVHKLTPEQKQEIVEILTNALKDKFILINMQSADEKTIENLKEFNYYNPKVKNLFLSKDNKSCLYLFDGEHVTISSNQDSVEECYKQVKKVADILSYKISMSYNDEYGFLFSDISKIGSGLKLEAVVSLTCVKGINKIEQIKQNLLKLGYTLSSTNVQNLYKLTSNCNLGSTDSEIILDFNKILTQLEEIEVESAKMLDLNNHDDLLDKTLRSVGILNSAYLLNAEELNAFLTNIRIGLNLGFVEIDLNKINQLQKLYFKANKEYVSQSELKELAQKAKDILKGE